MHFLDRDLPGCDFLLRGHQASSAALSVLYVTESDFVGGNRRFKQRLAKFYTASRRDKSDATVICQRTEASTADFLGVQANISSWLSEYGRYQTPIPILMFLFSFGSNYTQNDQ